MLSSPRKTLAYHQSRVLCQHRDMSGVPCSSVSEAWVKFKASDTKPKTAPESEALWFYGMNHAVSMISAKRAPLEMLPDNELAIVEAYHDKLNEKAVRAFYYLLIVCIREARHSHSKSKDHSKVAAKFTQPVADFFCSGDGGEQDIHTRFVQKPPEASIGNLTGALQWQFYHSKFSGGYGGPKWGSIADCLHRFVTGEYSAEMMLDTIWTLQHNGGVLFNKGHVYATETPTLKRILDIQRSGQIPTAIFHDTPVGGYVDDDLGSLMEAAEKAVPGTVGPFVDWFMVEALGSVHKYPSEITKQTKTHGISKEASAAQKAAMEKVKKKAEAAAAEKAEFEKNSFVVMPGMVVKKIEVRAAEAA